MNENLSFALDFQKPFGLYIHVPFCRRKCHYCDFYSETITCYNQSDKMISLFVSSLISEIKKYAEVMSVKKIRSIYFGGGTPALLNPAHIYNILDVIRENFFLEDQLEISLEANPCFLTEDRLLQYNKLGINRISLGVQSLSDSQLDILGRLHDSQQALQAISAVKAQFENYNIDLIFAIPGQAMEKWQKTLVKILEFSPPHLSLYNLQIESGTFLAKQIEKGNLQAISEKEDAEMYLYAIKKLKNNCYQHYEISNFALEDHECYHNKIYWKYEPYLGLGPAAHSFNGSDRFYNYSDLKKYRQLIKKDCWPVEKVIYLSENEKISEMMIMGLRLKDGVSRKEFRKRSGKSLLDVYGKKIKLLVDKKLLVMDDKNLFLTEKGILFANQVFSEFLL